MARPGLSGGSLLRGLLAGAMLTLSGSCAAARFSVPVGAPVPRADGAAIWEQATRSCRSIEAYGGELTASGRVSGNRVPGLRLGVALDREGHAAVEARVAATLFFSLRGTASDAILILFQDRHIVSGRTEDLLDALVGLSIGPDRLMPVLAGCVSNSSLTAAETVGSLVRIRTADADVYLAERNGEWHVRAGTFGNVVVDYQRGAGVWPERVRLFSLPGRAPEVQLSLRVDAADVKRRDPSVFVPRIPEGFERVTLEWVRENGPLGQGGR